MALPGRACSTLLKMGRVEDLAEAVISTTVLQNAAQRRAQQTEPKRRRGVQVANAHRRTHARQASGVPSARNTPASSSEGCAPSDAVVPLSASATAKVAFDAAARSRPAALEPPPRQALSSSARVEINNAVASANGRVGVSLKFPKHQCQNWLPKASMGNFREQ